MKRCYHLVAAAVLMTCLAACNECETQQEPAEGVLSVSVRNGAAFATKADTSPSGKDADLRDVQLLLFSSDGSLYRRETFSGSSPTLTLERIKTGYYDVVAVANAPALTDVLNLAELTERELSLSLNDPEQGFVMYGQTSVVVTSAKESATAARAEITVTRHVGRVRLTTVQNGLPAAYGALQVACAFLENGFGTWNYGGTGDPSGYVNYAGRKAGKNASAVAADFISSGSDADCAALTFRSLDKTVTNGGTETVNHPFYSFPNSLTSDGDHFSGATSEAACVRLVVKASYGEGDAQSWYYPVTIENLERNKTYDVSFIIRGPGSPDPNQQVENGNLDVVISVDPWNDGGDFNGDF